MISARYASCWEDVRAATRRCSSARSVANKRIRVRRGLERGMCEGAFGISHYNRRTPHEFHAYIDQQDGVLVGQAANARSCQRGQARPAEMPKLITPHLRISS